MCRELNQRVEIMIGRGDSSQVAATPQWLAGLLGSRHENR
jgi:hypothetical protein